jgi:hypothetical protein
MHDQLSANYAALCDGAHALAREYLGGLDV